MQDVVNDLNDAGYPFQMSWFEPFFEFRFPHYGTVKIAGIEMEIRMGIEPWHVLGEEMSSSRYGTLCGFFIGKSAGKIKRIE